MRSRSYGILVNFGPFFREHKFSKTDISHISCQSATKFDVADIAAYFSLENPKGNSKCDLMHLIEITVVALSFLYPWL